MSQRNPYREIWLATSHGATLLAAFALGWVLLDVHLHLFQADLQTLSRSRDLAWRAPWLGVPFLLVLFPYLVLGRGRIEVRASDFFTVAMIGLGAGLLSGVALV